MNFYGINSNLEKKVSVTGDTMTGDLWVNCASAEKHIGFVGGKHQWYLFSRAQNNTTSTLYGIYDNTSGLIFSFDSTFGITTPQSLYLSSLTRITGSNKILWYNNNANNVAADGAMIWSSSHQHLYFSDSQETSYALHLGVHDGSHALDPDGNNMLNLGTPNHKWNTIYAQTSSIQTSDRNEKKDITPVSEKYTELFKLLTPVTYKFKDGTSDRTHVGLIAQDVEEAMNKVGLTDLDFAGFCKDQKTYRNENGEDEIIPDEYIYGLRYEEFIALNIKVIQNLMNRIEVLESKLK